MTTADEPTATERDLLADHFRDLLRAGRRIHALEVENATLRAALSRFCNPTGECEQ